MDLVRCPRCSTTVERPAGATPVCPKCGYGTPQAAPAAPAAGFGAPAPGTLPAFSAPPAAPPPQAVPARPGLVTAAGIIAIVYASLLLLIGLVAVGFSQAAADALADYAGELPPEAQELGATFFVVIGVFVLLIGGFLLLSGIKVLRGRNWARIVLIVVASLGLLNFVTSLDFSPMAFLQLALDGFLLYAMVAPPSSAWFRALKAARHG